LNRRQVLNGEGQPETAGIHMRVKVFTSASMVVGIQGIRVGHHQQYTGLNYKFKEVVVLQHSYA